MLKKITILAAVLLVVSVAFFSCADREFDGTAPSKDPIVVDNPVFKASWQGATLTGPDANGWWEWQGDGSSLLSYEFPLGAAAYPVLKLYYETENLDKAKWGDKGTYPAFTLKQGISGTDIAGDPLGNQYPSFDPENEDWYPLIRSTSSWAGGILGMQYNPWRAGDPSTSEVINSRHFKVRFTKIVFDFE
jgi:hypothetical protein